MRFWRSVLVLLEMILFALGALFIGCVLFPLLSLRYKDNIRRQKFAQIIHDSWNFFIKVMEKSGEIKVNVNGNLSEIKGKIFVHNQRH